MKHENRIEMKEAFAKMFKQARLDAGQSQEYLAKALGVSRTTIQNWEEGISAPNQEKGFELFKALDRPPLPYYLQLLYPIEFEFGDYSDMSEEQVENALTTFIKSMTASDKRMLLYLAYGDHGSSYKGILNLMTAHLQTPLRDRINIAQSVSINYMIAQKYGTIEHPEHIQPNIDFLQSCIKSGLDAVYKGEKHYTVIEKEE